MNIIDNNKYIEFKYILSGCRTILDAYYFADLYIKKNPEMREIIYSMINGKRYDDVLDFRTMRSIISDINECKYQSDANDIIYKKTNDLTQARTFSRMIKYKPIKPPSEKDSINKYIKYNQTNISNAKDDLISKMCPHCDHICKANIMTTYIVCGYHDDHAGYDWKGCARDWCFKCGKRLCKIWDIDKLFMQTNRSHDKECCKNHAKEYAKNYPDEYCQCNNKYVQRH
jgi:hypothetical protein